MGLIFGAFAVPSGLAEISKGEALSKFAVANETYRAGDYTKAIEAYESILQSGKESGPLYYNLGNSYLKSGHLGKAVLNYERAKRLIPRDRDLMFNAQYAVSSVKKYHTPKEENVLERAIREHTESYSKDEMIWILTILAFALAGFHLLSLYLHWPGGVKRALLGGTGILLIIFVVGFLVKTHSEKDTAIILEDVSAYFEPSPEATVHFKLPEGAKIKVLQLEKEWAKVERLDEKRGWVPKDTFERI